MDFVGLLVGFSIHFQAMFLLEEPIRSLGLAPLDVTCPPHLKNFKATCAAKLPGLLQGVRRLPGLIFS